MGVLAMPVTSAAGQGGRSLRGLATAPQHDKSCHSTVEGESCYTAVVWAMEHGIVLHPEWYPGLHVGSTFAEFQAHMNKIGHGGCSFPCDISHGEAWYPVPH